LIPPILAIIILIIPQPNITFCNIFDHIPRNGPYIKIINVERIENLGTMAKKAVIIVGEPS